MTHSVEKTLKDLGDKVDPAERAQVESAISDLRAALKSDDKAVIEKKTDALAQASAAIAQRAYASEQAAGAGPGAAGAAGAGGHQVQERKVAQPAATMSSMPSSKKLRTKTAKLRKVALLQ